MFKQIKEYFFGKKEIVFNPQQLVKSKEAFVVKHNKELTEIENFTYLLQQFKDVELDYLYLNQNVNQTITGFSNTIYDSIKNLQIIKASLTSDKTKAKRLLFRLPKVTVNGYLFFNDKENIEQNLIFNTKALKQLVVWMQDIIDYFEENKLSQDPEVESFCYALYTKLDVLYEFFFHLLCYIKNIQSENIHQVVSFSDSI